MVNNLFTISKNLHLVQLMFSNKDDPPSVKEARAIEKAYMKQWIQEARSKKRSRTHTDCRRASALE